MPENIPGGKRVVVIGVGNILQRDDGVGIHAVKQLKQDFFPPQVEIVDGGLAGIDLLYLLEDADYALIVDCLDTGDEPGAIFRLPWDVIAGRDVDGQIMSLHEWDLWAVLSLADRLGKIPEVIVFGMQPESIDLGTDLSPPVSDALPVLVQQIKQELRQIYNIIH